MILLCLPRTKRPEETLSDGESGVASESPLHITQQLVNVPSYESDVLNSKEFQGFRAHVEQAVRFAQENEFIFQSHPEYVGAFSPGVCSIFLSSVFASPHSYAERVWIIVGDVPPAYIVIDDAPDAASALNAYIAEMNLWIEAVRSGRLVEDCIPVNVSPTQKWAERLATRMRFLSAHLNDIV